MAELSDARPIKRHEGRERAVVLPQFWELWLSD